MGPRRCAWGRGPGRISRPTASGPSRSFTPPRTRSWCSTRPARASPELLSKEGLSVFAAAFMPDGKQILFSGSEPGHRSRIYLRGVDGGKPRAVTPEGYRRTLVTPDGKWVVAGGPDRKTYLYPLAGGEPTVVPGLDPEDGVDEVSLDGRSLYVHRGVELPVESLSARHRDRHAGSSGEP